MYNKNRFATDIKVTKNKNIEFSPLVNKKLKNVLF